MKAPRSARRQLESFTYRESVRYADQNTALVVGDPQSSFPALPGAKREALAVVQELRRHGVVVEDLIGPNASEVLQALFKQPYRILHLAGHGVYRYLQQKALDCNACGQPLAGDELDKRFAEADRITGMVIGDDAFLTPVEVRQMRRVPEFVFINCCHLGHIEAAPDNVTTLTQHHHYNKIAANVSTEFIRMGVRAVVAAGWAVDDGAASVFAKTFYREMFAGEKFGKAVLNARRATYDEAPGINTWGAYQCYGDPDFRLTRDISPVANERAIDHFISPWEAVAELDNLAARLRKAAADSENHVAELDQLLKRLDDQQWQTHPQVLAALGRAFGEAEQFETAIDYLGRALRADGSTVSCKDVETLANLEARHAMALAQQGATAKATVLIDTAIARLESLVRTADPEPQTGDRDPSERSGATRERLSLLGSAYKRKALMSSGRTRETWLRESLKCYRKAYAKDGDSYPLLNALTLELMLGWQSGKAAIPAARQKLNTDILNLGTAVMATTAVQRDFWTAAMVGDVALIEALTRPTLDPAVIGDIRDRYLEARKRGSPREFRSVLDQIALLGSMAERQPAIAAALGALRTSLTVPAPDAAPPKRVASKARKTLKR